MSDGALANLCILVVEDEVDARDLLETMLSVEGARVLTASSAEEALAELESGKVEVLLSDIGMPGFDGYWLIEQVRKSRPALPAVALTAFTRREDVERARKAGFDHHMGKPVDPDALVQLLVSLHAGDTPQSGA